MHNLEDLLEWRVMLDTDYYYFYYYLKYVNIANSFVFSDITPCSPLKVNRS
jgi:hypothetical protein